MSGHRARPEAGRPALTVAVLLGLYTVAALGMGLIPALLTDFRDVYAMSGVQLANINNAKDIGLVAALAVSWWWVRWQGIGRSLLATTVIGILGCVAYAASWSWIGPLVGAFLHGFAFSACAFVAVLAMYRLPPRHHRISLLLATFGVASTLAPALTALASHTPDAFRVVYLGYGSLLAATAGLVAAGIRGGIFPAQVATPAPRRAEFRRWLPDTVLFGTVMAAETVVVTWLTVYLRAVPAFSFAAATLTLALLWAVHTPVRALGDHLVRRAHPLVVVTAGAAVALAGVALLLAGGPAGVTVTGVVVFAVGVATLVPVVQGWVMDRTDVTHHPSVTVTLNIGSALCATGAVWVSGALVDLDARWPFVLGAVLLVAVLLRATALRRGGADAPDAPAPPRPALSAGVDAVAPGRTT